MTKRVYPFAESFSSQYKIHVGQKELNYHGVFGNKYRQEIYEKTRNLLFNGTKAVMGKIWNIDTEKCSATQPSGPGMTSDVSQTLLRGQTLIGQDGRLQRTTPVQEWSVWSSQVQCRLQRGAVCVRRPRAPGGRAPSVTAQPALPASSSAPAAPAPAALSALSSITVDSMIKCCAAAAHHN
ncbi:apoptosis regulatory protein Siva isoform X2 [Coregonus clupeaformis]|uniref:apoptosis regulatory protein Siva isoform X2 n=1 Tax=Coregonus clupeaformis TaxID=59861 RepID=UPI001BE10594|nr:apoptosis regulatory protein Siva isoform X2 [Coregonus clupeaformis]